MAAIDPDLMPFVTALPSREIDWSGAADRIDEIRSAFGESARIAEPVRDGVFFEDTVAEADGCRVAVRIVRPVAAPNGPLPVVLWAHGGGFVMGSAFSPAAVVERWAADLGVAVVSVEYRLAPEHPYPAATDDVWTALKWVWTHAGNLGFDRRRLGIAGASAGAGLAASIALRSRNATDLALAFQVLIYPMIDDSNVGPLDQDDPVWPVAANRFCWAAYLAGTPANQITEDAAAARASDLSGLPPAGVFVGAVDLFRREDVAYASRLMDAGVAAELHVYSGAPHGFDNVPSAAVSLRFAADLDDFVRRHVSPRLQ